MFTMVDGKVDEDGNTFMNTVLPDRYENPLVVYKGPHSNM
jgi:hypothetical protein